MSEFELPELQDTLLDPDTLTALFRDLATHAEVLDVLAKGGSTQRTDGRPLSLDDARELLTAGQTRAIQVRYRYESEEWRDTLMRVPGGIRLVRMKTPAFAVDSPE